MTPYLDLSLGTAELRDEIDGAIARVLDSGRYIQGPEVEAFESEFARYCGTRHCVGVANGLDALTLMLRALDIGEGDEVIVPSNTYIATWLAVSAVGARVVPVEPDSLSYNLDPERVDAAITRRTRAILVVHLYGQAAQTDDLGEIAAKRGLPLLVDAAQAHGVRLPGHEHGYTHHHTSAFSFYPSKNLGALGDGGAVVTDDGALAAKVRVLGNYGSREKYDNEIRGVNSRLDPLQAAILRVKLRHLDRLNRRRREIAARYLAELDGIPGLVLPRIAGRCDSVWHIFAVRHLERDWLARQLKQEGIGTLIHYPVPPHLSGAYRNAGFRRGEFPLAEEIASTELSLPLHPHLTEDQVEEVIGSICLAACLPAGAMPGVMSGAAS
jgi:dTDP-3-amino-3,4,6-trideoxy-alpha-D-glucose transaminase